MSLLHEHQETVGKAKPWSSPPDGSDESTAVAANQAAKMAERKAKKRKMDALYARKRRQRETIEENELKHQCAEMSKVNMKLQEANVKFEQMLADAKTKVALVEYGISIASQQSQSRTTYGQQIGLHASPAMTQRNSNVATSFSPEAIQVRSSSLALPQVGLLMSAAAPQASVHQLRQTVMQLLNEQKAADDMRRQQAFVAQMTLQQQLEIERGARQSGALQHSIQQCLAAIEAVKQRQQQALLEAHLRGAQTMVRSTAGGGNQAVFKQQAASLTSLQQLRQRMNPAQFQALLASIPHHVNQAPLQSMPQLASLHQATSDRVLNELLLARSVTVSGRGEKISVMSTGSRPPWPS